MKKIILVVMAVAFLSSCGLCKLQRNMNDFTNSPSEREQPGDHGAPFNEDK